LSASTDDTVGNYPSLAGKVKAYGRDVTAQWHASIANPAVFHLGNETLSDENLISHIASPASRLTCSLTGTMMRAPYAVSLNSNA
jgi:hypothetical protein